MKLIFISFFLLINVAAAAQTCIIIYVSHQRIVAGADRLYHQTLGGSNHSVYYGKKIFINGNCAWAMSGADYYDTIHSICRQVCGNNTSLTVILNRFQKRMRGKPVIKAMHQLLSASNDDQKKRFKGNLAELVFLKYEAHQYKAYRVTVSMPGVFKNDERLQFETDSIVSAKNTVGIFILGHYESFAKDTHPETWTNPAATIKSLIKQQSKNTPDDVSTQSDVLSISGAGFSWTRGN